ncbi:DUF1428 domain-containing protein [uncultured Ferrovibrio sp.]|jgi:uncharacterized protein YbaA (DUF1428 family)|uniref:DUF1428 domain-containing protein n=1 Tax=uncultured Ferrovibrio sp. TaxID=1576913 RepID=UPI00263389E0|nr:DUF1428 domain-containing protein [uncultured Ferrovibrio sp.]
MYVDGFVLPVPKKKIAEYKRMSTKAGKIWREYGALDYKEYVGDDLKVKMGLPFPKLVKLKTSEVPIFAYIVFKSRKHRDSVNAKVMKDPRLAKLCDPNNPPFDFKRMSYGGFKLLVK